jgi:hypothetical protein
VARDVGRRRRGDRMRRREFIRLMGLAMTLRPPTSLAQVPSRPHSIAVNGGRWQSVEHLETVRLAISH